MKQASGVMVSSGKQHNYRKLQEAWRST